VSKAFGIVVCCLIGVVALPAITRSAQAAVPALVWALVMLGLLRLAFPSHRRR
jgi:hypothetical protein